MRPVTCNRFQLSLFILLMLPMPALAIPAITCHCFTDRSYDPAHPAVADPYFLATTQNSFFAAVFGVEKKTIVLKKQKGLSADDLWIAYWLAARSEADPEILLEQYRAKGSWRQVAAPLAIPVKSLGSRVAEALRSNAADECLANAVVDELLIRFRFYAEAELSALRRAGAGNQELIMASLIAAKRRQTATQLYREVKTGGTSWGALLQQAKVDPADIQSEIMVLITKQKRSS
ncbi:MAG: hypothetical protein PHR66_09725 [Desulfuromonadaceae bacterium]|nr:hypothetical protein [Desulfuromonadaceae bacterium]